jgi:transcriptional regulator with XRE-family HTH domain
MSSGKLLPGRLGVALQRQRQRRKLSHAQLAKRAKLSAEYVREIERGTADVSFDDLERLVKALDWNLFELPPRQQEALPEALRMLLTMALQHIENLAEHAIKRLQAMEAPRQPPTSRGAPTRNGGGRVH